MLKKIFVVFFFYNSVQIFQYVNDKYSYQYEDWLINYNNGFVRRGLIGDVLFRISEFSNLNIQVLTFFFLIFLLYIFYKKSYNLLSKIKLNNIFCLLIFSPFFFFFYIVNHNSGIRKEFLLYIFFVCLLDEKKWDKKNYKLWIYSLIFPLIILVHEGLIFYLPFFFIVSINKN